MFFMLLIHESINTTRACWKISGQDQAEMKVARAHFMAAAFGVWLGSTMDAVVQNLQDVP